MTNLPLFARARLNDPSTSHDAANLMNRTGKAAAQARAVLDALRANPGSTSAELAEAMECDRFMPARRLADLRKAKLAHNGRGESPEKRTCCVKGTKALVWWAEDAR